MYILIQRKGLAYITLISIKIIYVATVFIIVTWFHTSSDYSDGVGGICHSILIEDLHCNFPTQGKKISTRQR